jgi:uncharacterized metal-binding protein YceD (DUF177 family)
MANPLIERILPKEAAARDQLIEYKGKVGDFGRLVEIVEADIAAVSTQIRPQNWRAEPVDIRLKFGWADGLQDVPAISGRASTVLPAVCQRCLATFGLELEASVNMLLLAAEAAAEAETHEVWELEEEAFLALDVVEEALVMAMPLAPTHDADDACKALTVETEDSGPDTARPFADLRSQMEKTDN